MDKYLSQMPCDGNDEHFMAMVGACTGQPVSIFYLLEKTQNELFFNYKISGRLEFVRIELSTSAIPVRYSSL